MGEEVREILRNAVRGEGGSGKTLGSRLRQRFAGIGLDDELPELRGEFAQPAGRRAETAGRGVGGTLNARARRDPACPDLAAARTSPPAAADVRRDR
jgi:hypothetical protein